MAREAPYRQTIEEYMMHAVGRAFDAGVPDLNPAASKAAFPSERICAMSWWLLVSHAVDYHA
ncbi:MAG TPA: hypothetical protein VKU01_05595 [Bryobacteraceae bacterium]|nr:hypothetical protein [Bryobacteraceae bacterium]